MMGQSPTPTDNLMACDPGPLIEWALRLGAPSRGHPTATIALSGPAGAQPQPNGMACMTDAGQLGEQRAYR